MAVSSGGSDNNAIDAMAFVLHFDSPFDIRALQSVSHDLFEKQRYPKFAHSQVQRVEIQNGFSHIQQEQMALPLWQKYREDGRVIHELRCEPQSIIFLCADYTRWAAVLPQALLDLNTLANQVANEKSLMKVSLQTTDKFKLNKAESAFDNLLSTTSRYLTQNVTQTDSQLWHVHQGWFDPTGEGRCLNVLNISLVENGETVEVAVDHISDTGLNEPSKLCDLNIEGLFNQSHEFNKLILSDLLQDHIKGSIGLN